MNRELSSFDIYVIVAELEEIKGSYIDKIYQLTRTELLIKINNKKTGQKEIIFIRNGEFLCRTQNQFLPPKTPSMFAMALRKYLVNGRIYAIEQHEFDRIIKIKIHKKNGNFTLIFELFSNGNILLLDQDGKIILPFIKQSWAHRTLKSHELYSPPPSQLNLFHLTRNEFNALIKKSKKDLVRTLAVTLNLGGVYAEELCTRANVDKNTIANDMDEQTINKLYEILQRFLEIFKDNSFQPNLIKHDGKIIDILPIQFQSYKGRNFVNINSFTTGLQEFITFEKQIKKEAKTKYQAKIEKLNRQLVQQKNTIEEFKKKIEQKKIEGDIIYLNFQVCNELLKEINFILKQKDKNEKIIQINKKKNIKNFDPTLNECIIFLQDNKGIIKEVKLDFRKTVSENAENAYLASKKYQEKLKGALEAINKTKRQIKTLKKKDNDETTIDIKQDKQFWFERFRWFLSSEGNIVIAGRDAKSNDKLVKKYLKEGDRYIHPDIHGAPSCIVKTFDIYNNKITISDKTLDEACVFAGSYSKAWRQFGETQVYWVLPEQVSKTPQSGEFLPKGAFIVRGKRNYKKCKLEIAVGEIKINNIKKVMGGHIDSVKKRSDKYVILIPGNTKKSSIAKKLSEIFHVSEQTIERILPPGDVKIVRTIGFDI